MCLNQGCVLIELFVFRKKIKAILDTGAPTIVNHKFLNKIKHFKPSFCKYKVTNVIRGSGEMMTPKAWIHLDMKVGNKWFKKYPVRYIPNFKYEMILGHELIKISGMILDLSNLCYFMMNNQNNGNFGHECINNTLQLEDAFESGKGKNFEEKKVVKALTLTCENKQALNQIINKQLEIKEKDSLKRLINSYKQIFSQHEFDLGHNETHPFTIDTGDAKPIKQRTYRTSPKNKEIIEKQISELLKLGVIEKSYSPWASPVIIVKNKNGSNRMCVDYRKLNNVTKKDSYPLPLIDETFDAIGRAKYFTNIDLAKGFYQFAVDPESREKTAITTHLGLF